MVAQVITPVLQEKATSLSMFCSIPIRVPLFLLYYQQTGKDVWSMWLAIPHPQPSHSLIIFRKRHSILVSLRTTDWAHLWIESYLRQSSLTVRWLNFITAPMFSVKPLTSLVLKNQNLSTSCHLNHVLNLTIGFIYFPFANHIPILAKSVYSDNVCC